MCEHTQSGVGHCEGVSQTRAAESGIPRVAEQKEREKDSFLPFPGRGKPGSNLLWTFLSLSVLPPAHACPAPKLLSASFPPPPPPCPSLERKGRWPLGTGSLSTPPRPVVNTVCARRGEGCLETGLSHWQAAYKISPRGARRLFPPTRA